MSLNQQITQYDYPHFDPRAGSGYYRTGTFTANWCYTAAYPGFGIYSLDMSPGNIEEGNDVQLAPNNISTATDPIYVHPDWTLATWSDQGKRRRYRICDICPAVGLFELQL